MTSLEGCTHCAVRGRYQWSGRVTAPRYRPWLTGGNVSPAMVMAATVSGFLPAG
jgi:hypothetical protein